MLLSNLDDAEAEDGEVDDDNDNDGGTGNIRAVVTGGLDRTGSLVEVASGLGVTAVTSIVLPSFSTSTPESDDTLAAAMCPSPRCCAGPPTALAAPV